MPTVPVTVLGPKGSGKTVYLASLFRRLAVQREDVGFFVTLPPEQSMQLNNIYNAVASPDDWPEPTLIARTGEWQFTCSVRTGQGEVFSPFTISYLDYAGEYLTRHDRMKYEGSSAIWRRIRESEFLLVLLDGEKALKCFGGDFGLIHELVPVFNAMEQSDAVAHFVVTKWDLLEAAGHSVPSVLECLLRDQDFEAFYRARLRQTRTAALRFVPVSAVGRGFAVPGPDGAMIKQGTPVRPLNVEIPFMAVMVDLFDREVRKAIPESPAGGEIRQRAQQLTWLRAIQGRLPMIRGLLNASAARSPALRAVKETMVDVFVDYVDQKISGFGERVERDAAELRSKVLRARSEQEAMVGVVAMFDAVLKEFEAACPGSRVMQETS